jgi:ribosomal protein L37AE/L43A
MIAIEDPRPLCCPFCGEDRQIERTRRGWFCNVCGKEFR